MLNFLVRSSFKKILKTKSQDIVNECMMTFNRRSAEEAIQKRNCNFVNKYANADNLCAIVIAIRGVARNLFGGIKDGV